MKKIVITITVAALLSATSALPAFADGWGPHHEEISILNPLWPVAVALSIPAAIVGSVARITSPPPVAYDYAVPPAPIVYERPVIVERPRVYVAPRAYYPGRGYYRGYRHGW